jgi:hypothetical protein
MGVLVVAGLVLFTINLVKTMRSKVAPSSRPLPAPRPAFVSRLPVR